MFEDDINYGMGDPVIYRHYNGRADEIIHGEVVGVDKENKKIHVKVMYCDCEQVFECHPLRVARDGNDLHVKEMEDCVGAI